MSPGADFYFLFARWPAHFAPPHPPWGKNRSPNLPISFPGIVGVYVPSLGELVIVMWPPIHNLHTHKHIHTQFIL